MGTMGFGRYSVSSRNRVPLPPQRMTTFMQLKVLLTSDYLQPFFVLIQLCENRWINSLKLLRVIDV